VNDSWRKDASCAGIPVEAFFQKTKTLGKKEGNSIDRDFPFKMVKRVCANCYVLDECRAEVMADEKGEARAHRFGFRAGMTAHERWKLDQPVS